MEYQKIINLLDNTPNQPTKFRTKNWGKINDDARGTYNTKSQIQFKTSMLKSSLCNYSDAYILLSGTIEVLTNTGTAAAPNNRKYFAPLTHCISEINDTQIDNAKYTELVMPMYNLLECSNNYSKTTGSLWQYYRD